MYEENGFIYEDDTKKILTGCIPTFFKESVIICIPEGIEKIADKALSGLYNDAIYFPSSIHRFGEKILNDSVITDVYFAYGIKEINEYTFASAKITNVHFPKSISKIDDHAFSASFLETVNNFSNITYIGNSAFENTLLEKVNIGHSTLKVEDYAFSSCKLLKEIYFSASSNIIPSGLCCRCSALEKINIGDNIEKIGKAAFANTAIKQLYLSPNVKEIGEFAFFEALSMQKLYIPKTINKIGNSAFANNKSIEEIEFFCNIKKPENDIIFYPGIFEHTKISEIVFPEKSYFVGPVLSGMHNLETVVFEGNVEILPANFFEFSKQVKNVYFENGVSRIGDHAFANTSIRKIFLKNIEKIDEGAFENCNSLKDIFIIPKTNSIEIAYHAFPINNNIKTITMPFSPDLQTIYGHEEPGTLTNLVITKEIKDKKIKDKFSKNINVFQTDPFWIKELIAEGLIDNKLLQELNSVTYTNDFA